MGDIKLLLKSILKSAFLIGAGLLLLWFFSLFSSEPLLQNFLDTVYVSSPIDPQLKKLGIENNFLGIIVATVILSMVVVLLIEWILLHATMQITVSFSKFYALLCLRLNSAQPLKPAYILAKSIILIMAHYLT